MAGVSSFIATNDVYIKCVNEDDFCTSGNPCGSDEGDCDTHDECQDGLFCESNNCADSLGFHSEFDCCYVPTVGNEYFCTSDNPCAVDEGDCDSNNECQTNLICDIENSCPSYLGFASDVNCCSNIIGSKFFYLVIFGLETCCHNCNFWQFFSLTACCPTLNVLLENDVKDKWGEYEGVYTFQGFSDGMYYWVDAEGKNAIWYKPFSSGSGYYWQMVSNIIKVNMKVSTHFKDLVM